MTVRPSYDLTPRELDAALARRLFGCGHVIWPAAIPDSPCCDCADRPHAGPNGVYFGQIEHYSTTGDGMLLVLEAMRGRGFDWTLTYTEDLGVDYIVNFSGEHTDEWGRADTLPCAVALAALEALEQEAKEAKTDG